jgi:hypothetical protein
MRWQFWRRDQDIEVNDASNMRSGEYWSPLHDSIAPLSDLTYSPLPLEAGRNDIYTQGYTWPKAQSDWYKWYNNSYWGNRLPDPYVGIGAAGPAYPGAVTQKMFWTQHSPEQKFIKEWTLKGGYYPYQMSVQQSADLIAQQQALWAYSAGHA